MSLLLYCYCVSLEYHLAYNKGNMDTSQKSHFMATDMQALDSEFEKKQDDGDEIYV